MATLGAGLAGCTTDEDDPPSTSPASPAGSTAASPEAPTRLEVAVYGDGPRLRAYEAIVEAYGSERPDVEVELVTYPDAATAAETVGTEIDGFLGPDVFLLDQTYLAEYVDQARVQPVDVLLEERGLQFGDDYQRVALTTFGAEEGLQCMPAETSPLVIYYNKELVPKQQLRDSGIGFPRRDASWGWREFAATARAVAGIDQLGPIKGAHVPADLETLTAFVRSAGSEVVDDVQAPTSLTLASEDALETIEEVASFARDTSVTLSADDLAEQEAVDWFARGDLGMFIGTREDLPTLRAAEGLRFDVVSLPSFGRSQSVARMNGYCINAGTDREGDAADFIAFAVGAEGSEIAAASEVIVPSNLDMVHSEAFSQPGRQPRSARTYLTAIRRSDPLPYSTAWLEVSTAADQVLAQLYRRPDIDLDESLEDRLVTLDEVSEGLFNGGETGDEEADGEG
jgi:multiple sugar transport system substrate-binding protein